MMKRILTALLIFSLLFAMVACDETTTQKPQSTSAETLQGNTEAKGTAATEPATTEPATTEPTTTEEPSEPVVEPDQKTAVLTQNGKALYQLVLEKNADDSAIRSAKRLGEALSTTYVAEASAKDVASIYIGKVQNAKGKELSQTFNHDMDYLVKVEGSNIYIMGNHNASLSDAMDYFLANLYADESGISYIGKENKRYYYLKDHSGYGIVGYDFIYDESGFAGGDIVFIPETADTYTFYWGDAKGKLANYTMLYSDEFLKKTLSEVSIQSFTAIPKGATRLLAYNGKNVLSYSFDLPESKQFKETQLYSFGALSDSHQGHRYDSTGNIPYSHFIDAVKDLSGMGASLIGMAGDFTYDNEEFEYQLHADVIKDLYAYNSKLPIYTVSGNHECKYTGFSKEWFLKYSRNVVDYDTDLDPIFTSDNDLDFVIELPDGSVMIYLNQQYYDYGNKSSRLLTDAQLNWLEARLEQYKDVTVFLYFHTFIDGEAGDAQTSTGKEYSLPLIAGTVEHTRFNALFTKYKNVVYFSGHSHQSFDLQLMDPKDANKTNLYTNIDNNNGSFATMVHIPSVAATRSGTNLSDAKNRSEGYLVRVYDEYVVFEGYDFVNNQNFAYATYIIMK